ncbi:MAG TPA: PAS domain-containing sensor histidine kinase [Ktedonobacteraceae bacterium]|nr:PAS domain-containing sensor histidine kinase [Ktedonobacteraceae bacterium]
MQTSEHLSVERILTEITTCYGYIPPFFAPASATPAILENLWQQTKISYIDNPLPALFKDELLAYLSRYCRTSYCMVYRSSLLHARGLTGYEIYALLTSPAPTPATIDHQLALLMEEQQLIAVWPEYGSALEKTILLCTTYIFLYPKRAERCRDALRQLLGIDNYNAVVQLLMYTKPYHFWLESQPGITYLDDLTVREHLSMMVAEEPRLPAFFLNYGKKVRKERRSHEEHLLAQRKQIEDRLLATEFTAADNASRLEAIFEAMTDGVVIYDSAGNVLQMNTAYRRFIALNIHPKHALLSPDERGDMLNLRDEQGQPLPSEKRPVSRMLKGEVMTGSNAMDIIIRTLDDRRDVQLNVSGTAMRNSVGDIVGGVLIFHDVTERRQLERRTQETLNALLAMAEALVLAPESGLTAENLAAKTANPVATRIAELTCSILGCRRVSITAIEPETEVMRPIAVVGLPPEQERQWWAEQPENARLSDSPMPELVARLRANEVLILDMTQPPFDAAPNPYNIHIMLTVPMAVGSTLVGLLFLDYGGESHIYSDDEIALTKAVAKLGALVIERERLLHERADAHANEMALREANQRMDEFMGIASHELKTPLTTIKGYVQLVARRLKNSSRQEHVKIAELQQSLATSAELLERSDVQVARLARLVNELLDASRIQANKLEFHMEPCDLTQIVQEAVQNLQYEDAHRPITVELSMLQPLRIIADVDRIEQVIANYLSNALKYSPPNAPIEVRVAVEGQMVRVAVRDKGPGLPAQEQKFIWERFYRAEGIAVQSGSGVGLGLGLHICRTTIERHEGQVGVDSTPGAGSTFWFTLPLAQDANNEAH